MFGDRTNGSLLHDLELYKQTPEVPLQYRKEVYQTPGDPEKEVYDGNITDKTE